ncbi:hypothetical protein [Corallococcus sp. AB045]|uniref:hypothetical protein n=1 Tax=Corallococcus sp. AB045 TaxID=2316719 RepID=UPI0011C45F20|nr:hypothetical protein [Corallococcus sp. AB045]
MVQKKLLGFGLGLALLTGSTAAWAGGKGSSPVYINISLRYASGSMGDARNSLDTDQGISITVDASPGSEFAYVNVRDGPSRPRPISGWTNASPPVDGATRSARRSAPIVCA